MTPKQFSLLSQFARLEQPYRDAARAVLVDGSEIEPVAENHGCASDELTHTVTSLQALELEVRGAFVLHSPAEFRVTVGHHDADRAPGHLKLQVGQVVRLVAHSTERWIPVRIESMPEMPGGYYEGVIVRQLAAGSKFQPGNRCQFGEDQVDIQTPDAAPARRRNRRLRS